VIVLIIIAFSTCASAFNGEGLNGDSNDHKFPHQMSTMFTELLVGKD